MPSPTKGPRLGSGPAHERLMLANLATSLFEHGRITTTVTKAKRVRPLAERLITFAKRGDLHARRRVMTVVRDKDVVHRLFAEIGPHFANRPGGYTRITKIGPRKGDNAPMAVIELVEAMTAEQEVVDEAERARSTTFEQRSAPTGATREAAEDLADESETAAAVVAEAEAAEAGVGTAEAEAAEAADVETEVAETEVAETEVAETEVAETEVAETEVAETEVAETEVAETETDEVVEVEESTSDVEHPYGEVSRVAEEEGFAVKAVEDGKVFYAADAEGYTDAEADVWFASAEAAAEAGFTPAEALSSAEAGEGTAAATDDDGAPEA